MKIPPERLCPSHQPHSPTWAAALQLSLPALGPLLCGSVEHEALEDVSSRDTARDGRSVRHRSSSRGLGRTASDTHRRYRRSRYSLHWTHNFLRLPCPPAPPLRAPKGSETTAARPSAGQTERVAQPSLPPRATNPRERALQGTDFLSLIFSVFPILILDAEMMFLNIFGLVLE